MSLLFDSYIVTLKLFFHFMAVEEEMRKLKTTRLEFPILSYIIVKYCNLFATFKLDQKSDIILLQLGDKLLIDAD